MTTWSIDSCAREAKCVKGLVIHYFRGKASLLAESARLLRSERIGRWGEALSRGGIGALDLLWESLVAESRDGSARAILELQLAGIPDARIPSAEASRLTGALAAALEVAGTELPAPPTLEPILEGYALALMSGATPEETRDAFFRYWLSYVK